MKAFKVYTLTLNLGNAVGFIPYQWDQRKQEMAGSKWRIYKTWALTLLLYNVYLILRCLQKLVIKSETSGFKRNIRLYYYTYIYLSLGFGHYCMVTEFGAHARLMNSMFRIKNKILRDTSNSDRAESSSLALLLSVIPVLLSASTLGIVLGVITRPTSFLFLTSVFSDPKGVSSMVKIGLGIFHGSLHAMLVWGHCFHASSSFLWSRDIVDITESLRLKSQAATKPMEFISGIRKVKYYHLLSVLVSNFNAAYGYWYLVTEVWLIVAAVFNLFQAIVKLNARFCILGLGITLLIVSFFTFVGRMNENSQQMILSWRHAESPKWASKFVKHMRALRVTISSFYYADRILPLTILTIIIMNSANLILTYRYD